MSDRYYLVEITWYFGLSAADKAVDAWVRLELYSATEPGNRIELEKGKLLVVAKGEYSNNTRKHLECKLF